MQNKVSINAPANYQYILSDINGRLIYKGEGKQGFKELSVQDQLPGMYFLQLLNNHQKQTERIIKQ